MMLLRGKSGLLLLVKEGALFSIEMDSKVLFASGTNHLSPDGVSELIVSLSFKESALIVTEGVSKATTSLSNSEKNDLALV